MKLSSILFGFALVVSAPAAGQINTGANPLDGKVFLSVDKLTGGERRDGTVTKIHWKVKFKGEEFDWLRTDVISKGTYKLDAATGAIEIKGLAVKASYDAKTGVLTWDNRKYKAEAGGK